MIDIGAELYSRPGQDVDTPLCKRMEFAGRVGRRGVQLSESGRPIVASKRKSDSVGGVPIGVAPTAVHLAYDVISNASCPRCGSQVILYFCTVCKKPVRPNRGPASA